MNDQYDIIVVGGGGSGLAAALSAAQHGCSVLLLEKQAQLGGTTGIAVGSFTANRTSLQQSHGVDDSAEAHAEDAGKFAPADIEARNNDRLRRWFLSHTAETLAWLQQMGLTFHGPNPEPPNRVPRMHNVVPGAKAYIATLHAGLLQHGGEVVCQAGVRKLIQERERVTGVTFDLQGNEHTVLARRGVVLACGDYANSPALIAQYKGDRFSHIEGINPFAAGDGHRLAASAGAQLLNMDVTYGPEIRFVAPKKSSRFQQLLPTSGPLARIMGRLVPMMPAAIIHAFIRRLLVTWQHPENTMFDDGAILVNTHGERFCKETRWPDREIALASQPAKLAYIVLDRRLIERYSAWPHFISTAPKIAYAYVADYLRLRPDIAIKGSLKFIAEARKLPVNALKETIGSTTLNDRGDWVLLGPCRAYFTTTEGGVAIDQSFRALDEDGRIIPGLYAVGQNGLGGQILWGHGLHIAWALTSGRLVGQVLGNEKSKEPNP